MAYRPSRRQVLAGAGASALALTAKAAPGAATGTTTTARGIVYEDSRGEGPRRPGDPGIAGVMVSNGRDVAVTDADGVWALAVEPGDHVFVIKPPHWTTRRSPSGLPHFSYLHQPEGTPDGLASAFPGVAPTGPLPASIDLPLQRGEEPSEFEALLVSDTQPENAAELTYVRDDIIAAMLGTDARFGINHGDVVGDDLSLYPRYLKLLSSTGIPWHHCSGNHDINYSAPDDRLSRETWKRTFGPRHYAFEHGEAVFLVLDNVDYLGGERYRGAFGPRQLQFVRNVLDRIAPDRLVVLSMHIPLRCYLDPTSPRVSLEVLGCTGRCGPFDMAPASIPDPLLAELLAGDTPRKGWVTATPCAHLWQAALPAGLAPGAHVLQVRAMDEYGREHLARTVVEVTA